MDTFSRLVQSDVSRAISDYFLDETADMCAYLDDATFKQIENKLERSTDGRLIVLCCGYIRQMKHRELW